MLRRRPPSVRTAAGAGPDPPQPAGLQPPAAGGHGPRGPERLRPGAARPTPSAAAGAVSAGRDAGAPPPRRRRRATASARPPSPLPASPAATAPAATPRPGTPSAGRAPRPQHSLTDPASPWVVVNKHRPLSPAAYVPADLVRPRVRLATSGEAALLNSTTAAAAEKMFAAAAPERRHHDPGQRLPFLRHADATYNSYVNSRGQAEADTASARPGYSEHQTGWAFDIGDGSGADSFHAPASPTSRRRSGPRPTPTGSASWCATRGCSTRSPGYYYEPWHLRYHRRGGGGRHAARGHRHARGVLRAGSGAGVPVVALNQQQQWRAPSGRAIAVLT